MARARIERLPFTSLDVLAYFFPGVVIITTYVIFINPRVLQLEYIEADDNNKIIFTIFLIVGLMFLIIMAYFIGHVIDSIRVFALHQMWLAVIGPPTDYLYPDMKRNNRKEATWIVVITMILFLPHLFILLIFRILKIPEKAIGIIPHHILEKYERRFEDIFDFDIKSVHTDKWFGFSRSFVFNNMFDTRYRIQNLLDLGIFCVNMSITSYICSIFFLIDFFVGSIGGIEVYPLYFNSMGIGFLLSSIIFLIRGYSFYFRSYAFEVILAFACYEKFSPQIDLDNQDSTSDSYYQLPSDP